MADPTSPINVNVSTLTEALHFKAKNAEALVTGGIAAVNLSTGLLEFADDASNLVPCGNIEGPEFGSSMTGTALSTEGDVGIAVRGRIIRRNLTVTGVASVADIGKLVFMTDGQTYTLTRPSADAVPYGIIVYKKNGTTTTTCDVYIFDFVEACLFGMAGGNKRTQLLGYINAPALLDITDNAALFDIQMFGHGLIKKIYAVSMGYDTDWTAGSVIVGFTIEATTIKDTAGAAIALPLTEASIDAATDRGTTIDLSVSIGSANEFHDGDNVTAYIENTGSTALSRTAGTGWGGGWNVIAEIESLPGA